MDKLIDIRLLMEFVDETFESVNVDKLPYIVGMIGGVRNEALVVIQTSQPVIIYLYDVTDDGIAVRFETNGREPSHVVQETLNLDLPAGVLDERHPTLAFVTLSKGAIGEDVVNRHKNPYRKKKRIRFLPSGRSPSSE